jgi:DNA segregation ATPase FtsK/SpoIIIE-like protein
MHIHSTIRSLSLRLLAITVLMTGLSGASFAQFRVAITVGPPALPIYEQPVCPGDGYIWTPGYWYWDDDFSDYYWVPGTWVMAPEVGFLWTPGWWGWGGDAFMFHEGFWGPTVGFYGGINYGFGYFGEGFAGGRWDNGHFFYNRAVANVNVSNIHNVYNTKVNNVTVNRVSYNGGNGGVEARPTPQDEAAANGRHIAPVAAQTQHVQAARGNPELRASANHGKPPIAATEKPGEFSGHGVVQAKKAGAPYKAQENRGAAQPRAESPAARSENNAAHPAVHPKDLPPAERLPAPNTGDAKQDQKYQKQQAKLAAQQDKERQKLQQKQDQEHQQMAQQKANTAKTQQLEQKHQQQTQQLQQRQTMQRQQMQARQAPRPAPARPR